MNCIGKSLPLGVFLGMIFTGCQGNYTPKPRGYLRIDFPEKNYVLFDSTFPYVFEYPQYGFLSTDPQDEYHNMQRRFNINFPGQNGTIHMTYQPLNITSLDTLIDDAVDFVYRHVPKATQISKTLISYPDHSVYGTLFSIRGKNVASAYQFYVTDSVNHFLRGSLYFNTIPDNDSLKPVVDFLKDDIDYLLKTLRWK